MMLRLTRLVVRNRWKVLFLWIVVLMAGGFAAGQMADRWDFTFAIPGKSAADANNRAFAAMGNGIGGANILVYHQKAGDVTTNQSIRESIAAVHKADPLGRMTSYFDTHADYLVSKDRHTMMVYQYPGGQVSFANAAQVQKGWEDALKQSTPPGVTSQLTGFFPILNSQAKDQGSGIWKELVLGFGGAVVILALIFGTFPAVAIPLITAIFSIMGTFLVVWIASYITHISGIVQFLIGVVGLGIAIDYSLLMVFRFREEMGHGRTPEEALEVAAQRSGRAIVISGTTVGISLLSMLFVPVPFIRSIAIGGMLIPLVSVLATLTIQIAVLSWLGRRINSWRIPLLWRITKLDADKEGRFWAAWSRMVLKRPLVMFLIGAVAVGVLVYPSFHINPGDAQMKYEGGALAAQAGRERLEANGFPPGIWNPMQVVVEGHASKADVAKVVDAAAGRDNVFGASSPDAWARHGVTAVEVVQKSDGAADATDRTYKALVKRMDTLEPKLSKGVRLTVAGGPPASREFKQTVYDNFPYALLFVVLVTFVLLARALHSIVLPLKAVLLNLVSLGAAYGVIVFVFQDGHGSNAIWGLHSTHVIISWIPLMIFAFLFGLSMDYEVFMLSRIREAYDDTGDTNEAVHVGLARTGKLVTSAATILMLTFIVLSTTGGGDFKQFAIGLAAGIIIDATLIRALLVPTIISLLGDWNWKLPDWARKVLFIPKDAKVRSH